MFVTTYFNDMQRNFSDTENETERLEFFSDAVIAIAATLLIIDIKVPIVSTSNGVTLLVALLNQWPSYVAFVISFLFIGIGWVNHREMFQYIQKTNHPLMLLNLLYLMFIVLVPYSASVLADFIGRADQQTAALFYHGTLTLTSLFYNLVWWYAAGKGKLINEKLSKPTIRTLTKKYSIGLAMHLLSFMLAIFNIWVSLIPILLIYIFFATPSFDKGYKKKEQNSQH